jgi:predicted nucleotidyltransferase
VLPSLEDIQRITSALVQEFRPQRVILFGSRAYGEPRADSDVDLLVVLPFEGSPVAMMSAMLARAYRAMPHPFALEVHPRRPLTPGSAPDAVMRDALERGVLLYEAAA